jgi:hypothetical protein
MGRAWSPDPFTFHRYHSFPAFPGRSYLPPGALLGGLVATIKTQ